MAYQTGSAANFSDLLNIIGTFLGAAGWTVNENVTGSLSVTVGGFNALIKEEVAWEITMYSFDSWSGGPVNQTALLAQMNHATSSRAGGNDGLVYEYHLFEGDYAVTGEIYCHCAFRVIPDYWLYISFGKVNLCDATVTYGDYFAATFIYNYTTWGQDGNAIYIDTNYQAPFIKAGSIGYGGFPSTSSLVYNFALKRPFDGVDTWSAPYRIASYDNLPGENLATGMLNATYPNTSYAGFPAFGAHSIVNPNYGHWYGALVGTPMCIYSRPGSGTVTDWRYIGYIPGLLITDCYNLSDGFQFSIGTDTYRVFPLWSRKGNSRVLYGWNTGPLGFALRG